MEELVEVLKEGLKSHFSYLIIFFVDFDISLPNDDHLIKIFQEEDVLFN